MLDEIANAWECCWTTLAPIRLYSRVQCGVGDKTFTVAKSLAAVLADEQLFLSVTPFVNLSGKFHLLEHNRSAHLLVKSYLELTFGEISVAAKSANKLFVAKMERVDMRSEWVLSQKAWVTDLKVTNVRSKILCINQPVLDQTNH